MSKLFNSVLIAIALLVGGVVIGWWYRPSFSFIEKTEEVEATVLLERIKEVTKLITLEGQLSEIYDYKDYLNYDISPLRKKALVRVNAKVSVGYDFNKMEVTIRQDQQKIIIKHFPKAEILSVDHNIDYYDVTEGFVNEFTPEDYNKINKAAKQKIIDAAQKSDLLLKADQRKNDLISLLESMLAGSNYTVEVLQDSSSKG